ncbi:hypothetical protein GCM10009574_097490 [Streptomyces asiaticus]|uniref:Uncharacterized protein n=3 Tax=Streptomyces TaxID=1883 RepID=A0ABP4B846_9ACTN
MVARRGSSGPDPVALVEIDLYGDLMIAASSADEDRLSTDRIDEVLRVQADRSDSAEGTTGAKGNGKAAEDGKRPEKAKRADRAKRAEEKKRAEEAELAGEAKAAPEAGAGSPDAP